MYCNEANVVTFYCIFYFCSQGEKGSNAIKASDLNGAIKDFEKKFKDKTRNAWASRATFTPVPGKYTLIEMADEDEDEVDAGVRNNHLLRLDLYSRELNVVVLLLQTALRVFYFVNFDFGVM